MGGAIRVGGAGGAEGDVFLIAGPKMYAKLSAGNGNQNGTQKWVHSRRKVLIEEPNLGTNCESTFWDPAVHAEVQAFLRRSQWLTRAAFAAEGVIMLNIDETAAEVSFINH